MGGEELTRGEEEERAVTRRCGGTPVPYSATIFITDPTFRMKASFMSASNLCRMYLLRRCIQRYGILVVKARSASPFTWVPVPSNFSHRSPPSKQLQEVGSLSRPELTRSTTNMQVHMPVVALCALDPRT